MNWKTVLGLLLVAAFAGLAWYLVNAPANGEYGQDTVLMTDSVVENNSASVKETLAIESAENYQELAAQTVEPPENLDASDEVVHAAVAAFSPTMVAWLQGEQQLQKWLSVVDQLARHELPSKHLPILYPKEAFAVIEVDGGFQNDPSNFSRWSLLIDELTKIDPKRAAVYYKKWSPFLESTYANFGNPQSFDNRVRTSIEHILMVEPIAADVLLKRPKVFYEYADPRLENADELSKWLWRLGPENMLEFQAWLKALDSHM